MNFLFVAGLVACVAATIPPPIISQTSGYKPLLVKFSCGFTPNDTTAPLDLRYTIDSNIDFVSCVGSSAQSIGSGKGQRVFTKSSVLRVKTCYNFVEESTVVKVSITVMPWIGALPVALVYIVVVSTFFGLSAFSTKVKLKSGFATLPTAMALVPLLSVPVYLIIALDLMFTAQTGNVSLGFALIAILCIAAGANYWYIGKLLLKFSDVDRKMDWFCTSNHSILKRIRWCCSAGLGVFPIVFSRWMDKDWTKADFDNVNRTTDHLRLFGISVLTMDLPAIIVFITVASRSSVTLITPTSAIIGVIIAIIAAIGSTTRTLYGIMNGEKTDIRTANRGSKPQTDKVNEQMLEQERLKAAELAASEAAPTSPDAQAVASGVTSPTAPVDAAATDSASPNKGRRNKKKVIKRQVQPFNPMQYERRVKDTGRKLPRFEDMT